MAAGVIGIAWLGWQIHLSLTSPTDFKAVRVLTPVVEPGGVLSVEYDFRKNGSYPGGVERIIDGCGKYVVQTGTATSPIGDDQRVTVHLRVPEEIPSGSVCFYYARAWYIKTVLQRIGIMPPVETKTPIATFQVR